MFIDDGEEQQLLDGDDNYLVRLGYFNREGVYYLGFGGAGYLEMIRKDSPDGEILYAPID